MDKKRYDAHLADLRVKIDKDSGNSAAIDRAIEEIVAEGGEHLARDLLLLLSDRAQSDEGMFSLIHAAEVYDDKQYISDLMSVICELTETSPRWASIVLMRVLNSSSAQAELIRQLRTAPVAAKRAVQTMCERMNSVSPEFLAKTVPVTIAASK